MSFTFLFVLLSYATIEIKHILLVEAASSDDLIFSVVGLQNTHPNTHIAHIIFNFNIFDLRRLCDLTRYIHVAAGTTATAILSLFIHFFLQQTFFFVVEWQYMLPFAITQKWKLQYSYAVAQRNSLTRMSDRRAMTEATTWLIDSYFGTACFSTFYVFTLQPASEMKRTDALALTCGHWMRMQKDGRRYQRIQKAKSLPFVIALE